MSSEILNRISSALDEAAGVLENFTAGQIEATLKAGNDPVTEADLAVNEALLRVLPRAGEAWLSEETKDDPARVTSRRLWVVDPIDGTREFVQGIPEWCVSVGFVVDGQAVAGGILSPSRKQKIIGSLETGVTLNGDPVSPRGTTAPEDTVVLASRSEIRRGEWAQYEQRSWELRPMGSVALKMGLVAAGLVDATWTLVPKHEWDVAAGTALVNAAGGRVFIPGQGEPTFNRADLKLPGLAALGAGTDGLFEDETFTLA
ncbi:MAG: 3'(2'),5'-bisphosphate nucleotidase CysQ [bacterium]|nr:3'(2'),5'-bisphosphate nucleotidase CysQ [bacterium]